MKIEIGIQNTFSRVEVKPKERIVFNRVYTIAHAVFLT